MTNQYLLGFTVWFFTPYIYYLMFLFSVGVLVKQLPAQQRTTSWPGGALCRLLSARFWPRAASRVQRRQQWRRSLRWCRAVRVKVSFICLNSVKCIPKNCMFTYLYLILFWQIKIGGQRSSKCVWSVIRRNNSQGRLSGIPENGCLFNLNLCLEPLLRFQTQIT